MKKNLFLLFSIYFFVLQPLIIGTLRGQANFFRLWAINLIAIILIGILYNTVEGSDEGHKVHKEHKEFIEHEKKPVAESKVAFHETFRAAAKEHKRKSELVFPTLISFLIAIVIFFMLQYNSAALEVMLVFALVLWFIVYLSLTLMFRHRFTKSFWKLLWTKLYAILLVVSLVLAAYDYYQVYQDYNASFQDYIAQNFLGEEVLPLNGYVFTGEGTVIWSGVWETGDVDTGDQILSSDVFSGMIASSDSKWTGTVLWTSDTSNETKPAATDTTPATTVGKQKLMDAVIYLLKKHNIPLITKKDISFTYVTFKNPYYNEWRTAYANKLIGKSTNPSKYIVCESYIVMKWILEKWNVQYTSSNVLSKYRAEAIKRNALNGCVKGKIVTDKTL